MNYDLIIIGGGPAGLTAAIYAARYKIDFVVLSAEEGGLAATAHKICNFPSHKEISGMELMQRIKQQVEDLGGVILDENATGVKEEGAGFVVTTGKNVAHTSKKLIIATGTKRKKLNIPGEKEFYGRGVSYCATCDAGFFRDKVVAVIGGSDAALTAALLLSEFAKEVFIIYRKEKFFRGDRMWIEAVEKNNKIKTMFSETVEEIKGDKFVSQIVLGSGKSLGIDGVFIEIGSEPSSLIFKNLNLKLNEKGYIVTDKTQKTNHKGVYAAGDITDNALKQIVTAAGEGAVAAFSAYKELAAEQD